jgi:CRISPR system Cascade subunit CasC
VIVLGRPEIDFIRTTAATLLRQQPNDAVAAVEAYLKRKETRENLGALRLASGLDAALFGRMVTSDILARGDGAVHVAHALTVHKEEAEPDYFVAIDDLTRAAGELGTGLMQTAELTSGLFYGYVVIDVPQLVSNLEGVAPEAWRKADPTLAARTIEHLIHLIVTTSPGAKRGATAPYGYADLVLVEAATRQPRSLMTAFHAAVTGGREGAVAALARHLMSFDAMYQREEARRIAAMLDVSAIPAEMEPGGLSGLARWAAGQITAAPETARAA